MRGDIVEKIASSIAETGIPVYVWRVSPFQLSPNSELPAIVVMDTADEPEDGMQCDVEHKLKVEILLFVSDGDNTVNKLRAEMQRICGKLADVEQYYALRLVASEIDIDHDEQVVGRGRLALEVKYVTERWSL